MFTRAFTTEVRRIGITAFAAAAFLATGPGIPAIFAKGGPTVTVDGDVSVEQPVQVHGVVETLNDLLYQPYMKNSGDFLLEDGAPSRFLFATFDVPDGKRLIVETLMFQGRVPNGVAERLFLEPEGLPGLIPLAVQYKSDDGYLTSTLPMKLRIDAIEGSTSELRVRLGLTPAPASLVVSVFGYLVDL